MDLSEIIIYPIKSTKGIYLNSAKVSLEGLLYDRNYAVINKNYEVITAREFPKLLKIQPQLQDNKVLILDNFFLEEVPRAEIINAQLFNDSIKVIKLNENYSNWVSNLLGEEAHIVKLVNQSRFVKPKYNSVKNDIVNFSDISPIHLISTTSLKDLNSKLEIEDKVSINNFRPNLLVDNAEAFEEDNWKQIQIGDCVFDVHYKTARCVMSTLNPKTKEKNKNSEPLRTLSKYRKNSKGEVCFGIYLIPCKLGVLNKGDLIKVLK